VGALGGKWVGDRAVEMVSNAYSADGKFAEAAAVLVPDYNILEKGAHKVGEALSQNQFDKAGKYFQGDTVGQAIEKATNTLKDGKTKEATLGVLNQIKDKVGEGTAYQTALKESSVREILSSQETQEALRVATKGDVNKGIGGILNWSREKLFERGVDLNTAEGQAKVQERIGRAGSAVVATAAVIGTGIALNEVAKKNAVRNARLNQLDAQINGLQDATFQTNQQAPCNPKHKQPSVGRKKWQRVVWGRGVRNKVAGKAALLQINKMPRP
jgi:hypothetical protein